MEEAIKLAIKAFKNNEVPVGCIIVKNNKIISKAYNKVEKNKNCLEHAELIAIKKASKKLKNWRLIDCDIYITLEPCEMCLSAIKRARIRNIYYSSNNINSIISGKINKYKINKYENESNNLIKSFFEKKR